MNDSTAKTTELVPETSQDSRPAAPVLPKEIGGRDGPEPTRFGDWEKNGRCIDF
ncbi:DUF1674 domain-containing protein [Ahniella affigens]|uniref:DUF1674 domain-containing protein n=1 Tax=Ahniella affigens TaxID=2021234 RepID=UPI001F0B764C|nr:DUF1674 domain-containing protein [Ahniella affigens]